MTQEEQDRIAYLRERGAKHVFTCVEIKFYGATHWLISEGVHALRVDPPRYRGLQEADGVAAQFDRECRYDYQEEGLSFDPRVSTKQSFSSKVFDTPLCINQTYERYRPEICKVYDLHAIDATPARWRGDAGSSPLDRARRPRRRREMT